MSRMRSRAVLCMVPLQSGHSVPFRSNIILIQRCLHLHGAKAVSRGSFRRIEVANLLFGYSVSAAAVARSATQYWAQLFDRYPLPPRCSCSPEVTGSLPPRPQPQQPRAPGDWCPACHELKPAHQRTLPFEARGLQLL